MAREPEWIEGGLKCPACGETDEDISDLTSSLPQGATYARSECPFCQASLNLKLEYSVSIFATLPDIPQDDPTEEEKNG